MFWWNKKWLETSHYVILAYFVFTFPVMMPELLRDDPIIGWVIIENSFCLYAQAVIGGGKRYA